MISLESVVNQSTRLAYFSWLGQLRRLRVSEVGGTRCDAHAHTVTEGRRTHRFLYSQGFSMEPFAKSLFNSFSPRGLRLIFSNSKRVKWVLLSSCVQGSKISARDGVGSTHRGLVSESEGLNK